MENPQRRTDDGQKISFIPKLSQVFFNNDGHFPSRYEIFGRGGDRSSRLVILSLGLLNVFLLIVAVGIGINGAKVTGGSLQVPNTAAAQLSNELNVPSSNDSDVIKAEEEAKNELERAIENHKQLKGQIERLKISNDNYQRQTEALHREKSILKSNISSFEGSCGRCLSDWILHNSSCYFFSPTVRKQWSESRADCVSRGADLVIIDDQEEQKFVSDRIESMKNGYNVWDGGFWIGLTDRKTEAEWVWINNVTEVEQRYWMDGEPNNGGHTGEDCAVAVFSSDNPWKTRYDSSCDNRQRRWICEMKSN